MKGFYEGIMLVGECTGMKVCEAKPVIRQKLIDAGDALPYYEPESLVVSRSGDECIVALTDQWYLCYSDVSWKQEVLEHVQNGGFHGYNANIINAFMGAVDWIGDWACSREFGLGTQLPWDVKWVIDSLSDSTIYMAYYTIAKFFHANGEFAGSSQAGGIAPEDLNDDVFSYIYLNQPLPDPSAIKIPIETLNAMKREFEYWYPMDLRVSAKDLIPNHLTMCLFNHAAIWKDSKNLWPRSMFCNGHIMVDAEKMSKSKGNFLMMLECVVEYSADATRFALADAGDSLDDANFDRSVANQAVSYLFVEEEWIREFVGELAKEDVAKRTEVVFMDRVFENELHYLIECAKQQYETMNFREALHKSWYEMIILRDAYRDWCSKCNVPLNMDVTLRFIKALILMMQPITPHWSETLYELFADPSQSVCTALWPEYAPVNGQLRKEYDFLKSFVKNVRTGTVKQKAANANALRIFVAHTYEPKKIALLQFMQTQTQDGKFDADFTRKLRTHIESTPELKRDMKTLMQFGQFMKAQAEERGVDALAEKLSFDQVALLKVNIVMFCLFFSFLSSSFVS
jgi:leucyl-tRNA synthetase